MSDKPFDCISCGKDYKYLDDATFCCYPSRNSMMSNESEFVCDWCGESAEYNKDIYNACDEHESKLTELITMSESEGEEPIATIAWTNNATISNFRAITEELEMTGFRREMYWTDGVMEIYDDL